MSDSESISEPSALREGTSDGNGNGRSKATNVIRMPQRGRRRRKGGGDDERPRAPGADPQAARARAALGLGALAAVSTVFGMMMAVGSDLPRLEEPAMKNSVILDTNGKEIGLLTGNQRQLFIAEAQIAP